MGLYGFVKREFQLFDFRVFRDFDIAESRGERRLVILACPELLFSCRTSVVDKRMSCIVLGTLKSGTGSAIPKIISCRRSLRKELQ